MSGQRKTPILGGFAGALIAGLVGTGTSLVFAAEGSGSAISLEEITVTAQKREQNLQDVPISVAVVSGDFITNSGISRLEDMAAMQPGLTINETRTSAVLFMRGIGTSDGNINFEQSVSTFVDGIYRNRVRSSGLAFLDVERVEVLRGPQTTYFGQNTIGGGISIVSKKPGKEWEGYINASHEFEFGDSTVDFAYGGPLTDTFGARLAVRWADLDGWGENLLTGKDTNSRETLAFRVSTAWQATENLAIDFRYDNSDLEQGTFSSELIDCQPFGRFGRSPCQEMIDNGLPGAEFELNQKVSVGSQFALPFRRVFGRLPTGDGTLRPDMFRSEFRKADEEAFALTFDYSFANDVTLTSHLAYLEADFDKVLDLDRTAYAVAVVRPIEEYEQKSIELRLTSPSDQTVEWIAGVYYQEGEPYETVAVSSIINNLSQFNSYWTEESEWLSVFGGITWHLSDSLSLDLGVRHTEVEKDFLKQQYRRVSLDPSAPPPVLVTQNDACLTDPSDVTPACSKNLFEDSSTDFNIGLNYDIPGTDAMVYGKFTTGFKSGGSAANGDFNTKEQLEYDSETAEAFELGIKSIWLDGRLELNAALFHTEIEDLQVSAFDPVASLGQPRPVTTINNAAKQTARGVELDGRFAATESLVLTYSLTFLSSEYDDFPFANCNPQELADGRCDPVTGSIDRSGESLIYASDFEGRLGAIYTTTITDGLDLGINLNVYYNSGAEISDVYDERYEQDGYERVDVRATLSSTDGKWSASIFGNNITDEIVVTRLGPGDFNGIGSYELESSRGAGYGVQFRYNF